MNRLLIAYILMVSIAPLGMMAQDDTGPQLPIVLEFADSLVGRGTTETEERAFLGNVRFRQGNVTVRADRAVQHVGANRVDFLAVCV
jgi:lipopolysaccharide export system protein LptA